MSGQTGIQVDCFRIDLLAFRFRDCATLSLLLPFLSWHSDRYSRYCRYCYRISLSSKYLRLCYRISLGIQILQIINSATVYLSASKHFRLCYRFSLGTQIDIVDIVDSATVYLLASKHFRLCHRISLGIQILQIVLPYLFCHPCIRDCAGTIYLFSLL